MRKIFRHRAWRWVGWAVLVLCVSIAADYALYPSLTQVGGRSWNKGENGLWLRYTWYFGEHPTAEWPRMVERLKQGQFRYAYFHVRFAERSGRLHFRYADRAKALTSYMKRNAPEVMPIAWVYAGSDRNVGNVNLDNPAVRQVLVQEAVWLVRDCGFSGVQWDYEICDDEERGLLALLEETRKALPKSALLSVAAPVWMPPPVSAYGWSEEYFGEVAERCDQIAVMTYDTGFYLPRGYVWLVKQQVERLGPTVRRANPVCKLLIGLPTYEEGTRSHNPRSENLRIGLKGVRESSGSKALEGVALFADYTTDEQEWQTYQRHWIGSN